MNSKVKLAFASVVVALTLASSALGQSSVLTGTFNVNQISYATADDSAQSLVPQTFVDVPDMAVVFYVALGEAVKVDFSASISSPSRGPLLIRLLFDDNPSLTIEPSKIRINPNSTATRYTATFLLPIENGLGPGNHIVKIQWRSPQPLQVTSSGRVLVVEHN